MQKPAQLEGPERFRGGVALTFTHGLRSHPSLKEFLGASQVLFRPSPRNLPDGSFAVTWGRKETSRSAVAFADKHGIPLLFLEDGFIRSTHPGRRQPPASLVLDPTGIYYDAGYPCYLESLIQSGSQSPELLTRSRSLVERLRDGHISKYNNGAPLTEAESEQLKGRYVLVIDQVKGDSSLNLGMCGGHVMASMLDAALEENPGCRIVVKQHPAARPAQSAIGDAHPALEQCLLLKRPVDLHEVIRGAERVYVGTSQVGFEALMHQKPVRCFGAPFYAGWGLTQDELSLPRRTRKLESIEALAAAALIQYSRYVHPVTGKPCEAEAIATHFELQRESHKKNASNYHCPQFWWWKRSFIRNYLYSPGYETDFSKKRQDPNAQTHHRVVWGDRAAPAATNGVAKDRNRPPLRIEDGFIRSVGLGSDLNAPWSLVVDGRGIYFDPRVASDLEALLTDHIFSASELERAARLKARLIELGLSKYNPRAPSRIGLSQLGDNVLLVPGQVEDDASIRLGCPGIQTNLELLREVRRTNPGALIVFKPHPDVTSGNRRGAVPESLALELCDVIEKRASLPDCLAHAKEVHTLTSLVGFEALLRGVRVHTYGQPFYSGWGLTVDRHPVSRRKRRLSLLELVAGTLLLYPRYVDPKTGYFCTAEQAVERLAVQFQHPSPSVRITAYPGGRAVVKGFRFLKGIVEEASRV